ncbi:VENN motif pre-toxin domain-containing protein [Escherichia coli]|nr:VENN motif pre-toxin domain-containing protein [Escherichia coli]EJT8736892.1 VENN motif pre-toxin domain-containing protein [Escherichia coli]
MSVLLSPLSLQAADIRRSGEDTFIIQQQRQEALEQQLTPSAPDVRLSAPGSFAHKINFPVETPCFQIKQTELKGADALPHWLPLQKIANGAVGHCLGAKGINLLMSTLQNRLVDHGYVTTRVLAPSQDLKSGILRLVVIPGVVRHVRLTPDSDDYIQLYSSFPAHEGSLLDLRDIEQGLENMQRLPGVQADMEIVPGEQPGESDILITRKQDKYWRLGFSLDDSGTRSTGRYLGGITFSLDNPFSLSDLLYVSATHNFPHYGGTGEVNKAANVAAHAVVNAALAVAQGNNALAGAAGAATGEVVGMIATQMYGKPVSELSETEKQTVSTLATVAAGLAGGLVGDSGASAVAGAQAGKTTVENNMLNVIATETAANTAAAIAGATGNASKDTGNDNSWDIGGGCEGSREQCAVRDPSRDGTRGPGHVLNGDNTDENKQPNLGKDVASATDKDKAELGGAGTGTPGGWGSDNEEKARHQEVQQQRFDELSKIYDKSHPVGELTVDGQTIRQSSVSNRYGTTKVFESQNLTDKQIHNYAQQLAGDTPLKEVRPGIYTAKLENGTSITLRSLSSSQEQTGARWTIDIKGNKQLSDIAYKYKDVEIKFK